MRETARDIHIEGLVQGVGFRPFIARHARKYALNGWVRNKTGSVEVHIEGTDKSCDGFTRTLVDAAPGNAVVSSISISESVASGLESFLIQQSESNLGELVTRISPDIAVCPDCLKDMESQNRRMLYPFTNCTNCGPRFSIVNGIPYDRAGTSMDMFTMCPGCFCEYTDLSDRRFHAQPISCLHCGPLYEWIGNGITESHFPRILKLLSSAIGEGKIVALKSTSGYQLICDPGADRTVKRLREIKKRPTKPFAVMFASTETLHEYTAPSKCELAMLQSPRRPVVIVWQKQPLGAEVNRGYSTLGAILPYAPAHYLIMKSVNTPALLFTSANLKGQPLRSSNEEISDFYEDGYCDAIIRSNLEIVNRQDDSIVKFSGTRPIMVRRARGYVPDPVILPHETEGILALGADMKNAFCIGKGRQAILSQYTGDLENFDVYEHFRGTMSQFQKIFSFRPMLIAADMHPDYHSTRMAEKISRGEAATGSQAIPMIRIQHHHAHIASVMAEHRLDEQVIGIAMDGTGYGTDGKIWGSEFMIADAETFERRLHFQYLPLPGGELAILEPWRIAAAVLLAIYGSGAASLPLDFTRNLGQEKWDMVYSICSGKTGMTHSCGAGRWFDLVAALLNLVQRASFDGEGPAMLENILAPAKELYPFALEGDTYSFQPVIGGIIKDLTDRVEAGRVSARFHNTVTAMIEDGVLRLSRSTGLTRVVLSGGVFQNAWITSRLSRKLSQAGLSVYMNKWVPANDGGIALGQMAIASKQRKNVLKHSG